MAKTQKRRWTDERRRRHGQAMRELADVRREARAERGGAKAKDVIFERWLKNPLLDPADIATEFPEVKLTTVYTWFNWWLKDGSAHGPASARGREKEIRAAQRVARQNSITNYRQRTNLSGPPVVSPDANIPTGSSGHIDKEQKAIDYFFYNTDERAILDEPQPRFHIMIENGFAAAGGARKYGERFEQLTPGDILLMYENHVGIVALGKVKELWDSISHKVPKYYTQNEMQHLDGGSNEYRIAVEWFRNLSASPISVDEIKRRLGNTPRGVVRRIVKDRAAAERMIEKLRDSPFFPEEIPEPSTFVEGAIRQVWVNAYERNRDAVRRCKELRGKACIVCGLDFGSAYGPDFDGFIHVHHLRPLSQIGREYVVDPGEDLCPVCPNCHAVIHYGGKLRQIDEVRKLFRKALAPFPRHRSRPRKTLRLRGKTQTGMEVKRAQ